MGMAPHTRKTYSAGDKPMKITELSTEALLARRTLAEKATPGPWYLAEEDADNLLVTSNSRKEMVDIAKCEMAHPEAGMEEPFASEQNANAQHIAANSPDVVIATIDELLRLREENARLKEALENLLRFAECQICYHESTHRGGSIWTICDDCGAKWADDEGGKPEFKEPNEIVNARKALAAAHRAVEEA